MRNINFLLLILTSLFINSCSQNDLSDLTVAESATESLNVKSIKRYINQRHPVKSRSNTQLIPIIQHGDTVAFLANYSEGWELFSNNTSLPMVLMKSGKGNFYPNIGVLSDESGSSFLDFYNGLINGLSSCSEDEDPNTTWVLYSEDREPGVDPVPHFVGIAATVEKQSYTPKGGRLKTQWNQMGNYNMFMPFRNDSSNIHAIVGCGAIAAAQMIYHSNKYFGVPATTETMATYNPEINRYEFSVPSSNVWSLMDSGENEHFCADPVKMIPTAIFLGNVARLIKTEYQTDYTNESSSKPRNIIPILSKMLNVQFSDDNLNWTAIVSTLKKGYPVFTTSYNNIFDSQKLKGHGYLIDKADFYSENLYDVYDIRISDNNPDIEDTEDHNEIEDSPEYVAHSLDYYRAVYGDIEYWPKSTIVEHWLMMNWGVEKYLNEVMVNADESILKISATKFDTNIIYKVN